MRRLGIADGQRWLPSFVLLLTLGAIAVSWASPVSPLLKLDHFGYRPGAVKVAILTTDPGGRVEVRDRTGGTVFRVPVDDGAIVPRGRDSVFSGDEVWWVDFTAFDRSGTYHLYVPALHSRSYDFEIRDDVYETAFRAAVRTFYHQRCTASKTAKHAGPWSDEAACHLTDRAVGPGPGEPDHGVRDLSGGWHDAGDYNKFVRAGVAEAIPESGNGLCDLLESCDGSSTG